MRQQVEIGLIVGAGLELDVDASFLLGDWVDVSLVHRERANAGIVPTAKYAAVALVHVEVDDHGPREAMLLFEHTKSDRYVGVDAEAFAVRRGGMMETAA